MSAHNPPEPVSDRDRADAVAAGDALPPEALKSVAEYLDLAIEAATAQEMGTGELLGLFYYYTHGIASGARQRALDASTPTPKT